jgi:hypothetical protein
LLLRVQTETNFTISTYHIRGITQTVGGREDLRDRLTSDSDGSVLVIALSKVVSNDTVLGNNSSKGRSWVELVLASGTVSCVINFDTVRV